MLPIVLIGFGGCGPAASAPTGTGAAQAAQAFFEAVARQDWSAAYDRLAPESRARTGADQFARLAGQYCRYLGFQPAAVHVTACEEHGPDAVAHVTLTGKGPHRSRFKDTAILRQTDGAWAIVLPAGFGRPGKP